MVIKTVDYCNKTIEINEVIVSVTVLGTPGQCFLVQYALGFQFLQAFSINESRVWYRIVPLIDLSRLPFEDILLNAAQIC